MCRCIFFREKVSKWLITIIMSFVVNITYAAFYKGEVKVVTADDFTHKKSETLYFLKTSSQMYELHMPKNDKVSSLETGDTISVDAQLISPIKKGKTKLKVFDFNLIDKHTLKAIESDNRSILVLMLDYADKKTTTYTSKENVINDVFNDVDSSRNNFLQSSFSQVNFLPDTNGDNEPDIYRLNIPSSIGTSCEYYKMVDDALLQASKDGINTSLYKHVMLVIPQNTLCFWGGLGEVGCNRNQCYTWIKSYTKLVYTHELGHNLGFRHAGTDFNSDNIIDCEYCDASGIMGSTGYRQVNAPHRVQANWYDLYPKMYQTVDTKSNLKLMSLDYHPNNVSKGIQVAKIERNTEFAPYYVSYRTNIGTFGMGNEYAKKVNIHRFPGPQKKTLLVSLLAKGESFVSPREGIEIKATKTYDKLARVQVNFFEKCTMNDVPCELSQNDKIQNLSGQSNYFVIDVPKGSQTLNLEAIKTGDSRPFALYLSKASIIHQNVVNDVCEYKESEEKIVCSVPNPSEGKWYILLNSERHHDNITLTSSIK